MVSLRFDSLSRRSSDIRETLWVSARQHDDHDALKGRRTPAFDETDPLLTRDEDEDDDKLKVVDDDEDDDDDFPTAPPPPPPPAVTPPTISLPAALSTSSSTSSESSESDTDSGSSTSSSTRSQSTTLSIPPILTSTVTTSTSSSQITTQPPTNLPLLTSSALPSTTSSSSVFVGTPGGEETGRQNDRGGDGGRGRGGPSTSCKVGIAFGVIAAVGLIVGLIWGAMLIRRRRRRHGQDEVNPRDYASRIGRRNRFDFNLPSMPSLPSLPFSFTTPLERFYKPKPEAIPKRQVSNPFNAVHVSGHRNERSDSSILNEAIQAAYQMEGGNSDAVPQGWLDEKRRDPNHLLPLLDPEPIEQASIRKSVVSWFKRSSKHHPLKLNPMSQRSSMVSTLTGGRRSRPGSQATQRTVSYYSNSGESAVAESSGARRMQDVPPLPDLGLQKAYTNTNTPSVPSPTESTSESVTAPLPVFTRDDAQAYYKSMWAGSSVSGSTERMSAMSSWTDVTRTTMAGGRSSAMNTPGLSPPPSFHINSNRTSAYPQTPITPGYTSTTGPGSTEGTRTREDLYGLYASTRGSVAGSAVGLGLQQQLQQQQQNKPADN